MSDDQITNLSFNEVKKAELDVIQKLRAQRKNTKPQENQDEIEENLVGLAFSGGGIRSATFGLGVLEALKKHNLLNKIDYLSTVSGGGYIGGWLSGNCYRRGGQHWLDKDSMTSQWAESIKHLRRYSNYLSPNVSLLSADFWSMVTIWLRNTLLIQLMIVLTIAGLLLVPHWLYPLFAFQSIGSKVLSGSWAVLAFLLSCLIVICIAGNLMAIKNVKLKALDEIFGQLNEKLGLLKPFKKGRNKIEEVATTASNNKTDSALNLKFGQNKVQGLVWGLMGASFLVAALLWNQVYGAVIDPHSPMFTYGYWLDKIRCDDWLLFLFAYASFVFFSFSSLQNGTCPAKKTFLVLAAVPIPTLLVFYLLIAAIMSVLSNWAVADLGVPYYPLRLQLKSSAASWQAFIWAPAMVLATLSLSINMLIGMQGRDSLESIREWWSRFGAWLAIYGFAWMLVMAVAIYGPLGLEMLYYDGSWKTLGTGWLGTTIAGLFAGKSASTGGSNDDSLTAKLKETGAKIAPFIFIAGLLVAVSIVLHLVITAISTSDDFKFNRTSLLGDITPEQQLEIKIDAKSEVELKLNAKAAKTDIENEDSRPKYLQHWKLLSNASIDNNLSIFGAWVACWFVIAWLSWRIDINEFSLNTFYRNRLTRCYLGASQPSVKRDPNLFTGFDNNDDIPLSDLIYKTPASDKVTSNKQDKADPDIDPSGPFHILNCALNLGGSSDLLLHTRHSAIFTLTPFSCGSHYVVKNPNGTNSNFINYKKTSEYGGKPTLGQAIAVSGAAASPNMGYHSSAPVAFLMTLFNARLGWWFPNPSKSDCKQASPTFCLWYLLKELFGVADEKSKFLAISDGGHFENLSAYELIKRKCKVIIISDGECDPKLQFEGLATLIRMCEVDELVAKIDIDVRAIQPTDDANWSQNRCAIGKIYYDKYDPKADPDGWLIYIKAAMNGHESTEVMQYKATHPDFPHESTGDQFYGEDQFESYRNLGRDITEKLFAKANNADINDVYAVATALNKIFSPTLPTQAQFTHHTDRLMKIWGALSKNTDLKAMDAQLFKPWDGHNPERSTFYLCSEMIQLMENVYLDIDLENTWDHEDNKGWHTLFEQWASSQPIKDTWSKTQDTYGERFQSFWLRELTKPAT